MNYIENLYLKWLEFKNHGISFKDVFEAAGSEAVAVYACREPMFVFIHDLINSGVNVKYLIDANPQYQSYMGIPVLKLSEIKRLDDVDTVIITLENERQIFRTVYALSKISNADTLDLRSLIELAYYCGIFLPKVQQLMVEMGTNCIYTTTPNTHAYKNLSQREKDISCTEWQIFESMHYNEGLMRPLFDDMEDVTYEYIVDTLMCTSPSFRYKSYKNQTINLNRSGKYINIMNNYRFVVDAPEKYDNRIFIVGACYATGAYTEDKNTIASRLQHLINDGKLNGKTYKVINYATHFNNLDTFEDIVSDFNMAEGDYVLIIDRVEDVLSEKIYGYAKKLIGGMDRIKYYDMWRLFERPHDFGEVFVDYAHVTHKGYNAIAEGMYKFMCNHPFTEIKGTLSQQPAKRPPSLEEENFADGLLADKGFLSYIAQLKELKNKHTIGKTGAIVVNCNPFTLGHRYVIEAAKKQVDTLYVFVVEEDKSIFPFADRIMLVKEGTEDMKGIVVLPSGKFIISSMTFPDYFTKDMASAEVDTSTDVTIFAEHIAPALGITVRFVGSEPFCQVTSSYNRSMKDILPKHNIEVVEIERIKKDDIAISASEVRRLLKARDFARIKKLVPPTTYSYLKHSAEHKETISE